MNSRQYWIDREKEARENIITDEARYNRVLMGYYDSLQESIQKEIDGFYGRYATKEGITLSEAKKRASSMDIKWYAQRAEKYVKEKDFSDQANQEMRLYNLTMKVNRLELLKANIGLEMINTYNGLEHYYEKTLSNEVLHTYNRLSGILGRTTNPSASKVNSIVNASFKGATFSENIWANQSMLKSKLSDLLVNGLVTGKSARELAPQIQKAFNTEKYQAERLMRTELTRVRMDSQIDCIKHNGFDEYVYVAFSANRACEECQPMDGKHFPVDKFQPGDNAPPMHPNCRCSIAAYSGIDTDLEQYYKDTEEKKNEWLKNKGVKVPKTSTKGIAASETLPEILKFESDNADAEIESLVIYDTDGNLMYTYTGSENQVIVPEKDRNKYRGAIASHNHPHRSSFSSDDFWFTLALQLKQFRASNPKGAYYIEPPASVPQKICTKSRLKAEYKKILEAKKQELKKKINPDNPESVEIDNETQARWIVHETAKEFSKKYGFKYGFEEK